MHHYRCQHVYILATASKRIVDTLKFFRHTYQMPQLSSANDMSNALKKPYPEVPFSHIGDDTISALTTLYEIFKNKSKKVHIHELPTEPSKVAERTCPAYSSCCTLPTPSSPRARPHGRTDKSKRPESHPTKECARARVRCL
jgi:hypothetical protein